MGKEIGAIYLLIVSSLIPAVLWIVISERNVTLLEKVKKFFFKIYTFFFAFYYFLMSAMKWYTGYTKENLLESFWNILPETYLHYGVVLLIIGIIAPVLMHVIFKGKEWKIVQFFDSVMFCVIFFAYFGVRKINNVTYCSVFVMAGLITLIMLPVILKKDIIYALQSTDKKRNIKYLLAVMLYWIVTIAIYIPNELYLTNASDFPMSYWYFFGKIMTGSVILFLLFFVMGILFLSERQLRIFCTVFFGIISTGYIQGMLLNGSMIRLDGTIQSWSFAQQAINLVIWFMLIGVIGGLYLWKREKAEKIIQWASIYLILIQLVSLGVMMISSDEKGNKDELLLTTNQMLEVSNEKNVIVFILDKFDGRVMDVILEEDGTFIDELHDFTYYRNATSEHCPTGFSVPFLLTGEPWSDEISSAEWMQNAYNNTPLIREVAEQNFEVNVYTDTNFIPKSMKEVVSNYDEGIQRTCGTKETIELMMQCSKYRMAPFVLKNYYQYDTSDIALLTVSEELTNIENDLPFYNRLTSKGLTVSDDKGAGAFQFIHMHGAHPPYIMTEEFQYIEYDARRDTHIGSQNSQAKGSLKIVYEYLRQMQELGVYDDSLIIITADHGYFEPVYGEDGEEALAAFPILFIKEPKESHDVTQISEAPVCHADLIPTIQRYVGIMTNEKTCADYKEEDDRVRTTIESNNGFTKYQIEGNVRDSASWSTVYKNRADK